MMLHTWAKRQIRDVEPDGQTTARIKLTTNDGSVWNTWDAPFGDPDTWCEEADSVLAELAGEWPSNKRFQVLFLAEDKSGTVLSQIPKTIVGKNKGAPEPFSSENPKAHAEAMASIAQTTERLLSTANAQIALQHKTIELLGSRLHDAYDFVAALKESEAMNQDNAGDRLVHLLENFAGQVPDLIRQVQAIREQKIAERKLSAGAEPPKSLNGTKKNEGKPPC